MEFTTNTEQMITLGGDIKHTKTHFRAIKDGDTSQIEIETRNLSGGGLVFLYISPADLKAVAKIVDDMVRSLE